MAGRQPPVGIVAVNYETHDHIARLIWSLHRKLGRDEFSSLVVVDNGSGDGSVELLRACEAAGLLDLIANDEQRYHGPALEQGLSWLGEHTECGLAWILDSDVVVLRRDTLRDASAALASSGAAAAGEPADDGGLSTYCLLLDLAQARGDGLPGLIDHGEPSRELQEALRRRGRTLVPFPFASAGYVVHVGRATLRRLVESGRRENRYYEWAASHNRPHFGRHAGAMQAYERLLAEFDAEVGPVGPEALVSACG